MTWANYDDVVDQLQAHGLDLASVKSERGGYGVGVLVVGSTLPVRCKTTDSKHEEKGWYWLSRIDLKAADGTLEPYISGAYGIWHANDDGKIAIKISREGKPALTDEERAAIKAQQAEQQRAAKALRAAKARQAAEQADEMWRHFVQDGQSGYLKRKGVGGHGVRYSPDGDDTMIIPMRRASKLVGLQIIRGADRGTKIEKQYWPAGMDKVGAWHQIGGIPSGIILVCEGYATGASLFEATNIPVAIAFDAGSIKPVVAALHKGNPRQKILICADDDYLTEGNPGVTAASLAAAEHGAAWVKPEFAEERPTTKKGATDFNDLHAAEGISVVRDQIARRLDELGWKIAPARDTRPKGEGESSDLPAAVSVMALEDAVERFIPIDDDKGEALFDNWTNTIVNKKKLVNLLAAGIRIDDVKRNGLWVSRGSYYMHQIGFDPSGKDRYVKLNTWRGWPMAPAAGKCDAMIDLLRFLCSSEKNSAEIFEYLLDWIAYPLQNPGAKMTSAIIMHGPQGTGKSMIFDQVLSRIYGNGHPYKDYSVILDQKALEDSFNADWENKLYVLAEEVVTSSDKWKLKNELKQIVTGDRLRIRKVFTDAYRQKNQLNMVFLSNENQPLPLDNDDRRHCVIRTPPPASYGLYNEVNAEINNGGVEAFYHHMLARDLSKFSPTTRPPMTESKAQLIGLALPSEIRFVNDYLGGEVGRPVVPCLSAEFYDTYLVWCRRNGERNPRASHHFWGTVEHLPGWKKCKQRVFDDLHCIGKTTPRNVVIPPLADLQAAGTARPDDKPMDVWVTEGYIEFRNAGKDMEGNRWAA